MVSTHKNCCMGKLIFWISSFAAVIIMSCNSLPPTEANDTEETYFDPRNYDWYAADNPALLASSWYNDGSLYFWQTGDTLRLTQFLSDNWQVETSQSGEYFRLVYEYASEYYALYMEVHSEDSLNVKFSDRPATSREEIDLIPATAKWLTLTRFIPWKRQPAGLPPLLEGNWMQQAGSRELQISQQDVILNGDYWTIDSVQKNTHAEYRMLISRMDSTLAVYYRLDSQVGSQLLIWNTTDDLQNRSGAVDGPWINYQKWFECLDLLGWYDGASYTYAYSLYSRDATITACATPRDSTFVNYAVSGTMQLSFSGTIYPDGQGSMVVSVNYEISNYEARRILNHLYLNDQDNLVRQLVDDSLYTETGISVQRDFTLIMVNDTLWLDIPGERVYFSARKAGIYTDINLLPFAYQFDPPKDYYPPGNSLIGSFDISDAIPERYIYPLEGSGGHVIAGQYGDVTYGGVRYSWVEIEPAGNLYRIEFHEGQMDRRWWYLDGYDDNIPFNHSSSFSCTLEP